MKTIGQILNRDPAKHGLVNNGQARIADRTGDKELQELRGELSTFVCEGQFADGMQKILRSFLDCLGRTSQKGAWVSGFYGSGKSHLLKMLCHLWQDTTFPDGATAQSLVPAIPDEVAAVLRELGIAGRRSGGLLAAAGAMPSGTNENVRLTILSVILRAVGLPGQYPQARFCLWLRSNGWLERVTSDVQSAGRDFAKELNDLYVSPVIATAVLQCDPTFASSLPEARQTLRAQFPPGTGDITTEDFLRTAKEAILTVGRDGRLPCTLIVLDELQQYVGESHDRSVLVTEVIEALSKQFDSHVIVVAAGQSALTEVRLLQKLLDRCTVRIPLSDADVETVTRRVLLQKNATDIPDVKALLHDHAGEISRQLQGTRIAERVEDRATILDDYPLLPARRRFWEECFRQIDAAGTHSQLRSQLQIIHNAVAALSDKPLGEVIPADELYTALAPNMVNTGVLLREINERIIHVGQSDLLAGRICGLVFLIGKLQRDGAGDIGVRATKQHIADLLVSDLRADNGKLRTDVARTLQKLVDDGVVMPVGDEYRLQTREGSEWDREFRTRQQKVSSDDAIIQFRRDELLYSDFGKILKGIRILQGTAKEPRQFSVHRDQTPPEVDDSSIPVWVRDQWSHAQKDMLEAARSAGADSPTLFVFIPKQSAEDLRRLIVETEAAQQTLDARGNPTTIEGQEARQSMLSRRDLAVAGRDGLITEIVSSAKVFQGGSSEVLSASLDEKLRSGAEDALVRLFPRFKEADSVSWPTAMKRAKEGADQPLQPVGHSDATEKYAVCQQVLSTIGSGMTGADVRKALKSQPFGWPQDAIDTVLIALHRAQHISGTLNGVPVALGQLDQNKISKAEFRVEQATLSVQERLQLRKLFQHAGLTCKSGDEVITAPVFLSRLIELARSAGGDVPLPAAPSVMEIEDLQKLVGNEQLRAIKEKSADIDAKIKDWTERRDLITQRRPVWETVQHLARHAHDLEGAQNYLKQVAAVSEQRILLEPSDPVAPIRVGLGECLRAAINEAHESQSKAHQGALETLQGNELWGKVAAEDRTSILQSVGLVSAGKPDVSSDKSLASHLDSHPMATVRTEIDAIPGRLQQAIEQAARKLEPKVQPVSIERATLRSAEDVNEWLERTKQLLLDAVERGPVLIK